MEAPAEPLELLLAEAVAVAGGLGGVVAGAVGFDGEDEPAGLVGVLGGEVDAVAPDAVLADERDAGLLERVADVELERVELGGFCGLAVEVLAARLGVGEVEPQQVAAALGAARGPCRRR